MSYKPSVESLARKITRKLIGTLHVDLDRDLRHTVFLAGSGRSGTTWLSQVMNYDNRYRYLFEPFHPRQASGTDLPEPHRFIPIDAEDAPALAAVRRVFEGRVRNRWVDNHNRKLLVRERLVKDVWSNLYLGWIARQLPEMKIVFLLRHPCAVANSRHKSFQKRGLWTPELEQLLAQEQLVAAHLAPFVPEIRRAARGDLFDQLVFKWCIENYVPLRQQDEASFFVVFYEDLCARPREVLPPLFEHLGAAFEPGVMDAWGRASPMRFDDSAIMTGGDLVSGWREQVTSEQAGRAERILALFGLDRLYGDDDMPRGQPQGRA